MKASDFLDQQIGPATGTAGQDSGTKPKSAKAFLDEQLGPEGASTDKTPSSAKTAPSPPPAESWGQMAARIAAGGGAAVAQGLAGAAGLPGTVRDAVFGLADKATGQPGMGQVIRNSLDAVPGLAGGMSPGLGVMAAPNSRQTVGTEQAGEQAALSAAGLPGSYLAPQSKGEQYFQAGARGLGGSLPLLALGPAAMGVSGVTGGLGSQLGEDVAPGTLAGPLIGGLVGGGLGQGAVGVAQRAMAPSLAKLATTVGGPTAAGSMEEAGQHLQTAATKFLTDDHKAMQAQAWAPVDAAIDPDTPVGLGAYKGALAAINKDLGPMTGAAKLIGGGALKAKELLDHANALTDPDVGGAPTWSQMANFRTYLGDNLSNARVNVDIPSKQMRQLYAGLTSDMRTAAHAQDAGDAFDAANAQSSALFDRADQVAALTKTGTDKPEVGASAPAKVAESLIRGARSGGTDLQALRAASPDLDAAVNQLAAAHLSPNEAGTQLPLFHKLSEEGQAALLPYGKIRAQAVAASKNADLPSKADLTNTAVGGLLGGEMGRYAAEMAGLSPSVMGGLALGGAVAPFAIRNAKALTARPLSLAGAAQGAGDGETENDLPDLVVRRQAGR